MPYDLSGHMSEVCTCAAVCPCFAAQDPDGGRCSFNWVFDVERGTVGDEDVSGLRLGFLGSFEGNPTEAQIRLAIFVDDQASDVQHAALVQAFTGELGGPLGELAGLFGEVVAIERVPIEAKVTEGTGSFRIGELAEAEMQGFESEGRPMVMTDMPLSPVLGSPGYPGLPVSHRVDAPEHGFRFEGNSSIQTRFHYVAA